MDSETYRGVYYAPESAVPSARGIKAVSDYISLLKPRVVLLHLFTASTAMVLAAGGLPSMRTMGLVLAGGGLVAGAANTLNCYFDREFDRSMPRTRNRPLPAGRLPAGAALAFGLACAASGLSLLAWLSLAAAALAFSALIFYAFIYTLWLKRNSSLSAIFSSGIGAVPPLVGWVAVTGRIEPTPLLLFAVIALWTPPHFWALATARGDEYEQAGLRVVPRRKPAVWITAFLTLLVAASLLLGFVAGLGGGYLATAAVLGSVYLAFSFRLQRGKANSARILYLYSIVYLVLLFTAMLAGGMSRF